MFDFGSLLILGHFWFWVIFDFWSFFIFAYASLLRNVVLHCDFPVVSPPPWKIHNTRYPYRSSCVDEGKGLSRVICPQASSGQRTCNSVELWWAHGSWLMGADRWMVPGRCPKTVSQIRVIVRNLKNFPLWKRNSLLEMISQNCSHLCSLYTFVPHLPTLIYVRLLQSLLTSYPKWNL